MKVLDGCRKKLGTPPRLFSAEVVREIKATWIPLFVTLPFEPLNRVFTDQEKLLERGEVVWAQVLQANNFLFNPGLNWEGHAATIIHAGPSLDDPSPLVKIARNIASLGPDERKKRSIDKLMHESKRKFQSPIPKDLTDGLEVFGTDLLIFRKLLPPQPQGATLQKLAFPLLILPEETKMVMQLPSRFWPEDFLEYWESR